LKGPIGEKILGRNLRKIAIFASGSGSNCENLILKTSQLPDVEVSVVITDNPSAFVIDRCKNLETEVVVLSDFLDKSISLKKRKENFENKALETLKLHGVNWVYLAGFMRILSLDFLKNFPSPHKKLFQVVNIHPSLLPEFKGANAFQDAWDANVSTSGISVHFVDGGVDTGHLIAQQSFKRKEDDKFEDFFKRGREIEEKIFPNVLENLTHEYLLEMKMSHTMRVEVVEHDQSSWKKGIIKSTLDHLNIPLQDIQKRNVYHVQIEDFNESKNSEILQKMKDCLHDPILSTFVTEESEQLIPKSMNFHIDIFYRAGVTDNSAKVAVDALKLQGINAQVSSGISYYLSGSIKKSDCQKIGEKLLANPLIQNITCASGDDIKNGNHFENIELLKVESQTRAMVEVIDFTKPMEEILDINNERCWALTEVELNTIKEHYQSEKVQSRRRTKGLPENPTDLEVEVLAQTWSEHCKHKIFAADIEYIEEEKSPHPLGNMKVESCFKTFIKGPTERIIKNREISWAKSIFVDNAGIVDFDDNVDFCIKVETHNSPSALDPYGGSLTGILGVNRDILGCGMGAKCIGNTDVFCFAPYTWPSNLEEFNHLPAGPMPPRRILDGVYKGVEDGGNKSGIPTINGSIFFHQDYAGKPLVYVGSVGVLPKKLSDGRETHKKSVCPGDRVLIIGGATGADGIHGATFSSLELNENSPVTAVQIGDPITQKRTTDFLLKARDLGLYRCITDNGAGGVSSSVGEMAEFSGGVDIDLSKLTLKYPGLSAFELMISESQERMTFAVDPKHLEEFLSLAVKYSIHADDIGSFTDTGLINVWYKDEIAGSLDIEFLHSGYPNMNLKAKWKGPQTRTAWMPESSYPYKKKADKFQLEEALTNVLGSLNVRSKESIVRQYDHEVQAATVVKPFTGITQSGPSDAGVLWAYPHGGAKDNGVCVSHGMAPKISTIDPYYMAQYAVDEAVRNSIATGGLIEKTCALDNFCWPDPVLSKNNPNGDIECGNLVRTCVGLAEICEAYGIPLVSGKDSMKNNFSGSNNKGDPLKISVLPTLLVTAMSQIPVNHVITTDFKKEGDLIFIVGKQRPGLDCSEYSDFYHLERTQAGIPSLDLPQNYELYQKMNKLNIESAFHSCHDVSEGGAIVALVESMFGGDLGASISVPSINTIDLATFFFGEGPGRFVFSIPKNKRETIEKTLTDHELFFLGEVISDKKLNIVTLENETHSFLSEDLLKTWKREF
jgi:phosphoribosylformylglycinamidine synthase subunit PurSL